MQILVLFVTIGGGIYFMVFEKDSPVALTLAALAPLGWVALFMLRFFTERKKRKEEEAIEGKPTRKKFVDPNDLLQNNND